jgi:hypothetical protein
MPSPSRFASTRQAHQIPRCGYATPPARSGVPSQPWVSRVRRSPPRYVPAAAAPNITLYPAGSTGLPAKTRCNRSSSLLLRAASHRAPRRAGTPATTPDPRLARSRTTLLVSVCIPDCLGWRRPQIIVAHFLLTVPSVAGHHSAAQFGAAAHPRGNDPICLAPDQYAPRDGYCGHRVLH